MTTSGKDGKDGHGFGTRAIHAGQSPDPTTGAVMTPIYYTSTYAQQAPGVHKGFEYSRTHNLTRYALEGNLASLEGGVGALCFASGLAATSTLLSLFDSGGAPVVHQRHLAKHVAALECAQGHDRAIARAPRHPELP